MGSSKYSDVEKKQPTIIFTTNLCTELIKSLKLILKN